MKTSHLRSSVARGERAITLIILLLVAAACAPRLVAQTVNPQITDATAPDSTIPNAPAPQQPAGTTTPAATTPATTTPAPTAAPVQDTVATAVPATPTRFTALRASGGMSRGVLAGGTVALVLSAPLGDQRPIVKINGVVGDSAIAIQGQRLLIREVIDSAIIVDIPSELPRGQYEVRIELAGGDTLRRTIMLERPHILMVESFLRVVLISLIPIALLGLVVWWIARNNVPPLGARSLNFLEMLLLEPVNMTYSLSRAQFILWTVVLAGCYVFLFVARGLVESIWTFPPLDGFAGAFLISLGTLLASQATTSVKGAKGAGEQHPAISDLFVHGGVIALERVQQALWTLVAAGMFVYIVFENYAQSTSLPTIPDQLLYLMGISSAGYITGKAIRRAGPIIAQVDALADANIISILGTNISNNAQVWVDGAKIDAPVTVVVPDAGKPSQFARAIQIAFPAVITSSAQWYGTRRCIVVENDDGQRAEWRSGPRIIGVIPSPGATAGTVALAVTAHYVAPDMTWQVTGIPAGPAPVATRDPNVPNQWNLTIPDTGQTQKFATVVVRDANGQSSTYSWLATTGEDSGSGGDDQGGDGGAGDDATGGDTSGGDTSGGDTGNPLAAGLQQAGADLLQTAAAAGIAPQPNGPGAGVV
jgi:hypothetical protein